MQFRKYCEINVRNPKMYFMHGTKNTGKVCLKRGITSAYSETILLIRFYWSLGSIDSVEIQLWGCWWHLWDVLVSLGMFDQVLLGFTAWDILIFYVYDDRQVNLLVYLIVITYFDNEENRWQGKHKKTILYVNQAR